MNDDLDKQITAMASTGSIGIIMRALTDKLTEVYAELKHTRAELSALKQVLAQSTNEEMTANEFLNPFGNSRINEPAENSLRTQIRTSLLNALRK